jgi:hypothetical protein
VQWHKGSRVRVRDRNGDTRVLPEHLVFSSQEEAEHKLRAAVRLDAATGKVEELPLGDAPRPVVELNPEQRAENVEWRARVLQDNLAKIRRAARFPADTTPAGSEPSRASSA